MFVRHGLHFIALGRRRQSLPARRDRPIITQPTCWHSTNLLTAPQTGVVAPFLSRHAWARLRSRKRPCQIWPQSNRI